MAGDVVEADAVVVEVVEHGQAGLVALPVVGLRPVGAETRVYRGLGRIWVFCRISGRIPDIHSDYPACLTGYAR